MAPPNTGKQCTMYKQYMCKQCNTYITGKDNTCFTVCILFIWSYGRCWKRVIGIAHRKRVFLRRGWSINLRTQISRAWAAALFCSRPSLFLPRARSLVDVFNCTHRHPARRHYLFIMGLVVVLMRLSCKFKPLHCGTQRTAVLVDSPSLLLSSIFING